MEIDQFIKKQRTYQLIRKVALMIVVVSVVLIIIVRNPYIFIGVVVGLGLIFFVQDKFSSDAAVFKANHLKNEIEKRFPSLTYEMDKGMPSADVFGSGLLKKHDYFESEDLLYGKINQRRFRTSDVTTKYTRLSRGGHQVITAFKGKYYEIELPFIVKTPIYIVNNGATMFGNRLDTPKIELEYIDFNHEVDVYSKDEQQAFKVLKPAFMEKILQLRKIYGSIAFGFINKTMVVAIEGKNSFEFYIHRKVDKHLFDSIEGQIEELILLTTLLN